MADKKAEKTEHISEKDAKAPNVLERAKEEIEAVVHSAKSPTHHHETHGRNDDIDETTPVEEVKGPSVLQRAKEEIEALAQAVHPKKDSEKHGSSSN